MLVDNLLNVSLHFAVPGFIFWWAAGTAMAGGGESRNLKNSSFIKRVLTFAAVVLMGFSWYWVKTWNREVRYFAGFKLLRQNSMAAAVKELELSRSWGPPEVNSIYELGNAYARSERFAEAVRIYQEALGANAGYDEIYYNVGVVKSSQLKDVESAIAFFRIAWWINPLSAEVYNTLGGLYLRQPDRYHGEALDLLENAVRIFPGNPNHWNNLGYLFSLEKDAVRAEEAYTRALRLDPGLKVAEQNLAAMARQRRGPKPAILDALDGFRQLQARINQKDYSESTLLLASRVAGQFPDLSEPRFIWGSLLLNRGRPAQAREALAVVVAKEPRHVWAHVNLGEAYAALGQRSEAGAEFRAALRLDPGNQRAGEDLKRLGP